mgnify:CR=1 FL=1
MATQVDARELAGDIRNVPRAENKTAADFRTDEMVAHPIDKQLVSRDDIETQGAFAGADCSTDNHHHGRRRTRRPRRAPHRSCLPRP